MASDRMENTLLIGVLVVGVVATLGWAFVVFRDFRKAWEDHNGMAKRVVVFEQEQRKQQEQQAQREKQQREHYEKQLREKEQQAQTEHNGNEGSSNNQASKVFLRRHRAL